MNPTPLITNIGPLIKAPANASRLFETIDEALRQPIGEIQLAASSEYEYIYNSAFKISQIRYDLNYCTSNIFHLEESKDYFERLFAKKLARFNSFVEIGCGQGEFVEYLKGLGFDAVGFDPVLKQPTNYLFDQLWTLNNERDLIPTIDSLNTLYIMRCVLPHIPEPYSFLDSIFEQHPNAGVLIEFQRRDWIEQNKVWPQISHDHVNIFSEGDFKRHYSVLASGIFSNNEWAYILLTKRLRPRETVELMNIHDKFEKIFKAREEELTHLNEIDRPIAIYGAAGKGIVFGFTLIDSGFYNVCAIDADKNRQGQHMDSSGIRVLGIEEAINNLPKNSIIAVMNPNHLVSVSEYYSQKFDVACIGQLTKIIN